MSKKWEKSLAPQTKIVAGRLSFTFTFGEYVHIYLSTAPFGARFRRIYHTVNINNITIDRDSIYSYATDI